VQGKKRPHFHRFPEGPKPKKRSQKMIFALSASSSFIFFYSFAEDTGKEKIFVPKNE